MVKHVEREGSAKELMEGVGGAHRGGQPRIALQRADLLLIRGGGGGR